MLYRRLFSLNRSLPFVGAAILLAAGVAHAQSNDLPAAPLASGESSSSQTYQFLADDLNAAANPALSGGGTQYDNRGSSPSRLSRWTFEAGAGFNSPIGNDTPYITWGGNLTLGGGLRFRHGFSLLGEYQFMDNKLPGAFVAAGGGTGGSAYINSITLDPMIELLPRAKTTPYFIGGGGWYHKSTNFTVQVCCDFYGYPVSITTNSFSSDQWGGSIGFGIEHRLGGTYGDGSMKLFAEARYLFIDTPPITETNGLGTTGLIPVTFGVRF